jgi:PAS domain S-box-containing protein
MILGRQFLRADGRNALKTGCKGNKVWRRDPELAAWRLGYRGCKEMPSKARVVAQPVPVKTNAESTEQKVSNAQIEDHLAGKGQKWQVLDMMLSSFADFAYVFDREGRFLYANHPLLNLWGLTLEEAVGKTFFDLNYPADLAARLHGQVQEVFATGQQILDETLYTSPAGVDGYYEYIFRPVVGADGTIEMVSGATRDITVRRREEEHLAQMEGRYRGLLEAAPDAMVVVNQGGEIVLLNAQAENQFGYSRDELIGQKVKCIIPEGFAERLIADGTRSAAEALAQQIGTGIELIGLRKNGSEFPIEIMLSPLESAEGILITAAIRNITVRKQAETHLAQMEGRYRGLLEAAPDAMVVVNQGGEIVLLNAQAENQFGYRRDELLGQQVTNIIAKGFAERLIADGTRSAAEALAQQIGTGIELIGLRKDGSEFPIEIMLSPLESAEGTLITAAIRNITARKKAEKYLAQMEGRYRGLLEAAPDAMVVVNQEGEIVLLNAQAENQFGYHRNELLGQKVTNIITEGFAERLIADALRSAEDALGQQIGTGIELSGLRKDGTEFPIELMLSPLQSPEGILVTAAIRNITARKAAEKHLAKKLEELFQSNQDLEQFAAIASHDLQEPLRMVASYTQLIARRYKGKLDSDADEFIEFAVDGATRMQQLIQDLLAYSRVASRGAELLEVSSEGALKQAIRNLDGAIKESGAVVSNDSLPCVQADESQLVQLFQNLVGNAIKYQKGGVPNVHISAVMNGNGKWMFSVKDNGLGIEPKFFERIFGMFQRLHKREEFSGTGIGLAICKKIVERHGGIISVESQLGQGSIFHFSLDAAELKSHQKSEETVCQ